MTSPRELVTAVIPTFQRPNLVLPAVESALAQTWTDLEVIVVIDGPDGETAGRLSAIDDPRLRVLEMTANVGAAEARNVAVRAASGRWIAFLDDDDRWLPGKIARQMEARPADMRFPIMSCRCQVVTARGSFDWPRRLAAPGEAIGDYLFVRNGFFKGETFAPTTTLLAPRELLLRHPFPKSLFDDWEWLLSCGREDGCGLVTVPEVLAVHATETNRVTLSTCRNIDAAIAWCQSMRPLMSPRAYASLILQVLGGEAAAQGAPARWRLLKAALEHGGAPTPAAIATFAMHTILPVAMRRRLRQALFSTPGKDLKGHAV
jgi:glycosyltransferase involved in cell wall biosynthesis